jgi:ABC-2 type transport system ATP-binding protein
MNDTVITLSNITKRYGNVTALDNMSFEVKKGELLGLLGPNGSGKTTTIRLLNGVIFPDKGSIKVKGFDTIAQGNSIRKISGVFTETASMYDNMTVYENLDFFARLYSVDNSRIDSRINELIERFGLGTKKRSKAGSLSTGLKKRLGIAKALIHNPEILFLDEPTSSLDPESARDIILYIKKLNEEGVTVFVCTHNLKEAEHFCTKFVFLDSGRILEEGTIEEIERKYIAAIELKIDFNGELNVQVFKEYGYRIISKTSVVVKLPGKIKIPELIRMLSQNLDIYGVSILNSNLEALYFEIRKASNG